MSSVFYEARYASIKRTIKMSNAQDPRYKATPGYKQYMKDLKRDLEQVKYDLARIYDEEYKIEMKKRFEIV